MALADYLALITSEHATQPKFTAWASALLTPIMDVQTFLTDFYENYDIDTAVGAQLDVLGIYLNCPRRVTFQPSNGVSANLDDATYRILLKSKIAFNHFDGTLVSLYSLFQTALGNTGLYFGVQDNQDMSYQVVVFGATTSIIQDLITHGYIIPRPEGVKLTVNITTNKVFAFGVETSVFGGFGEGYYLQQGVQ